MPLEPSPNVPQQADGAVAGVDGSEAFVIHSELDPLHVSVWAKDADCKRMALARLDVPGVRALRELLDDAEARMLRG